MVKVNSTLSNLRAYCSMFKKNGIYKTSDKAHILEFDVSNVPNIWHLAHLRELMRMLLPFYICHFTMSKWMAKAEEKNEKKNIVETLLQRCFLFYGLVYFLSSSKTQVINRALILFLSGLDTIRPQFQLQCTLPVICLFSNPRITFQPRLR